AGDVHRSPAPARVHSEERMTINDSAKRGLLAAAVATMLVACSGDDKEVQGGQTPAPAPAPVDPAQLPNDAQAVRFLTQATFGPTRADIDRLKSIGYENWIEEQFALPRSSHLDYVRSQIPLPIPENTTV